MGYSFPWHRDLKRKRKKIQTVSYPRSIDSHTHPTYLARDIFDFLVMKFEDGGPVYCHCVREVIIDILDH